VLDTVDLRAGRADEVARILGISLVSVWRIGPAPRTRGADARAALRGPAA
jgi:hypothetical protein